MGPAAPPPDAAGRLLTSGTIGQGNARGPTMRNFISTRERYFPCSRLVCREPRPRPPPRRSRCDAGLLPRARMEHFFHDMGFPDAERACGTGLRHAERNFFVRQHWLFDTPAPQPVAGRRHLPKRCSGSGCARPVATLKGAGSPHRTPALMAGFNAVPCASAPRHGNLHGAAIVPCTSAPWSRVRTARGE